MKYLKHINEFRIYENTQNPLFINQDKLKDLLLKNEDFAIGEVADAITDSAYVEWKNRNNWNYEDAVNWLQENFGNLPAFTMYLNSYNGQVCNGGHHQYFDNGYASANSRGFGAVYHDIDAHDNFVELFKILDISNILPSGKKAYDVISKFELDLEDEIETCDNCSGNGQVDCSKCSGNGSIDCEECDGSGEDSEGGECSNCDGNGTIDCDECDGKGSEHCDECDGQGEIETGNQNPDTNVWELLDTQWYEINEEFMKEFDDYLKSLTLDGEKISELVDIAYATQAYKL